MWWYKGKGGAPNFGDAINPYLIEKLGEDVHVIYVSNRPLKESFMFVQHELRNLRKPNMGYIWRLLKRNNFAYCIGSVLENSRKGNIIWGSGFMNYGQTIEGGTIFAVRGKETLKRLVELGFNENCKIGDPAILLPLVYNPIVDKEYDVGIIPHVNELPFFKLNYSNNYIIDLNTDNIESVIDNILSCKLILSSSLHGIIVAHAYGIPAIWLKYGNIGTDGFKFHDYFSSVNIDYYNPISIDEIGNLTDIIDAYEGVCLPNIEIDKLQMELLSCAPFQLKSKFIC